MRSNDVVRIRGHRASCKGCNQGNTQKVRANAAFEVNCTSERLRTGCVRPGAWHCSCRWSVWESLPFKQTSTSVDTD